jgi:hypothetical protein
VGAHLACQQVVTLHAILATRMWAGGDGERAQGAGSRGGACEWLAHQPQPSPPSAAARIPLIRRWPQAAKGSFGLQAIVGLLTQLAVAFAGLLSTCVHLQE